MKRTITLPRPAVGCPENGWRERVLSTVAEPRQRGLALEVSLASGARVEAPANLEGALGRVPRDRWNLLEAACPLSRRRPTPVGLGRGRTDSPRRESHP